MAGTADRRGFLLGLGALVAAPAIVRASSLMPIVDIAKRDARLGALGEHIWVERIYSDFAARISPMPALQLYPIRPGASIWKGDFVYVDLDGFVHREMRPGTCDGDIKDFPPSPGILVAVAAEDSPSGRLARTSAAGR